MEVGVRRAGPHDAPFVVEMMRQLLGDLPPARAGGMERALLAILRSQETNDVLVAVVDDRCVGLLVMSYRLALHHGGKLAVVEELVVDEGWRRRGIGSLLVARGIELARERQAADVEVVSAIHRDEAHRFYERLGFERRSYVFTLRLGGPSP